MKPIITSTTSVILVLTFLCLMFLVFALICIFDDNQKVKIKIKKMIKITISIFLVSFAILILFSGFTVKGAYNTATISGTLEGTPNDVTFNNKLKVTVNNVMAQLPLESQFEKIKIEKTNNNDNLKAEILVKYKFVENKKAILAYYKQYGYNYKNVVGSQIKAEISKQKDFAKSGKLDDNTIEKVQKLLNNSIQIESIDVTEFVSSNQYNVNLNN